MPPTTKIRRNAVETTVELLRANADAYHFGRINHETFATNNRTYWRRADVLGIAVDVRDAIREGVSS